MNKHKLRRLAMGLSVSLASLAMTTAAFAYCSGYFNHTSSGTIYTCSGGYKMQQTGCEIWCCPGNGVAQYSNCDAAPTNVLENNQPVPCPSGQSNGSAWTPSITCPKPTATIAPTATATAGPL